MTLDQEWKRLPEHALLLSGFNGKNDGRQDSVANRFWESSGQQPAG
jgi:hypothetical protein